VDAGHPICLPSTFAKFGFSALRPAKSYLGRTGVYSVQWNVVGSLLPGKNECFDLILPDDSCKAFFANGIVVQARLRRKFPGYKF